MMLYSKKLVLFFSYVLMKMKGAIALYRFRSLIKRVGKGSRCHISVQIKYPEKILIGDNVAIGPMVTLGGYGGIKLDDYVRISKGVTIESASLNLSGNLPYKHTAKPIHIKEGAWLGTGSIILGGVTVGKRAVVGAGAIVTKDVPDGGIIVSQPVRVIK